MDDNPELCQLRLDWETNDQWQLRQAFLQRHWDKMQRNRLISLSQIFINVEFLGCQYAPCLMELVDEMSEGLTDNYKAKRQVVVQNTFVKAGIPFGADQSNKRSRGSDLGTRTPHFKAADAKKPRVEEEPQTPIAVTKTKLLNRVKAQLTIAASNLGPLELMNHACNRCKVNWKLDFSGKDHQQRCSLSLEGVLVTRQFCGQDKLSAKLGACKSATERLQYAYLDVREVEIGGAKCLCLFSTSDTRSDWFGPEQHMFGAQEEQLTTVRLELGDISLDRRGADPRASLELACNNRRVSCEVITEQLAGWKQRLAVKVAGVALYEQLLQGAKSLSKDKVEEQIRLSCSTAIQQLLLDHHRVYEDSNGRVWLLAAYQPITDEMLTQVLKEGRKEGIFTPDAPTLQHIAPEYKGLIVMHDLEQIVDESTVIRIINHSCQICQVEKHEEVEETSNGFHCAVFIGGSFELGKGVGPSKKDASIAAHVAALQKLQQKCYTIIIKTRVDKKSNEQTVSLIMEKYGNAPNSLTSETNIGNKLMRKMGWKGGGIGKDNQGIAEPITVQERFNRQGLGLHAASKVPLDKFRAAVRALLQDYIQKGDQHDIVFGADLTNQQRQIVHKMAQNDFGFKTVSYGAEQEKQRQLTVQRKRTPHELLAFLVKVGGETTKYKLMMPKKKT